jgi:23S rRNA (uracil1939-C5)-methyltransferase
MATSHDRTLQEDKAPYARIAPPCPYFGVCGGCSLQDLAYHDQLALKRERLSSALAPVAGLPDWDLIGLDDPWRYRNKAELTFGSDGGRLVLGYHAPRSFWRIVDLDDCLLMPEPAMRAARLVLSLASDSGLPAYHPRTHQGFFRYLIVRASQATGKLLMCLITTAGSRDAIDRIAAALRSGAPSVASGFWGTTDRLADIAVPETLTRLWGDEHVEERIGRFSVRLHPLSFLQPSLVQAERIYAQVADAAGACDGGTGWDLYCGLGLAGFHMAGRLRMVYGIDSEPHHLELARSNAARNRIANIEFRAGKVEDVLRRDCDRPAARRLAHPCDVLAACRAAAPDHLHIMQRAIAGPRSWRAHEELPEVCSGAGARV